MIDCLSSWVVLLSLHAFACCLELVSLFVPLLDLLVVLEVGKELSPSDEFFVVDGVILL